MPRPPPTTPSSRPSLSKLPYAGFVEGTDKGDTKAEPKIWTEMDKFNAAAAKMQEEMVKLNVAAKTGNIDTIKAAVGATGQVLQGLPRQLPQGVTPGSWRWRQD